jgi:hypothetical protein
MNELIRDVHALATPAGRMIGTRGHADARAYLVGRLRELGLAPYGDDFEQPYTVEDQPLCNVIAVAPGRRSALPPVLIAAHYDTCGPLPGADDNAAAVAVTLEVAARLVSEPAERDVIVALFDGEEPPCSFSPAMGSIHWYHHQRRTPVHCAIVLDLVGHDVPIPGLEDLVFVMGMESDPGLVFDDLAVEGVRIHPALNRYVGDLSDHHVFRTNQRPFLFLSCGRWEHYHSRTDTPDRLNYAKMAAIARLTETMARRAARVELSGPFDGGNTLPLEVAAIRRHFGSVAGIGTELFGRRGVDAFVGLAMTRFGL